MTHRDTTHRPAAATIRTQVEVPLRFPDGYETVARVLTFDGLDGDGEHLAVALGSRAREHGGSAEPA
ncbi:MAG: GTP cyclohydrolase, partial [Phycicoccus sp.]